MYEWFQEAAVCYYAFLLDLGAGDPIAWRKSEASGDEEILVLSRELGDGGRGAGVLDRVRAFAAIREESLVYPWLDPPGTLSRPRL